MWQPAHTGFARCCAIRSRIDSTLPARRSSRRAPARSAAAAAAACRACSRASICRGRTGDVRVGVRGHRQDAALPQQPAARLVGSSVHAPEVAAVDVGDPVVARQPLVDERVVGASADRATLRSSRRMLSKNSSVSSRESPGAGSRRSPETASGSAPTRPGCAGTATARRSWSRAPSERGSASIRRTCRSSTAGSRQLARAPPGRAARRRECCSRGRTTGATPARDR